MSKTVLIIGNGFDINCGLNTRYKNVYDRYIASPSKNKLIIEFKKSINNDYDNWSDFEIGMANYAKNYSSENDFMAYINIGKVAGVISLDSD